jgi:ABC-type nickel/cobalt efflux system permease component RcnA
MSIVAAPEVTAGVGVIATAFVFGLRHGVDWDHIAAITDITGSQQNRRDSLIFSTLYALGHASVVLALGIAAIVAGRFLPIWLDSVMETVVGVTLLSLAAYLIWGLVRHGSDLRMRSRWMLVIEGVRRVHHRIKTRNESVTIEHEHEHDHSRAGIHHHPHGPDALSALQPEPQTAAVLTATHAHPHRHVAPVPQDPFMTYGRASSLAIGMLHGVGAETPTQVLIFITVAGVGGAAAGVLVLVSFLAGLLASNTAMAVASTYGFSHAGRSKKLYVGLAAVTAVFSLVLGSLYLLGHGDVLPHLL